MLFLTIVTYFAFVIQILFVTVAIASGLYYLAELVEEYTVFAKKCIWWINTGVLGLYIGFLLLENFPYLMIICGMLAQLCHYVILNNFPYVVLTSIEFISAIILVIVNHYLAFHHFASFMYSFSEVMAYFTLCLWLIPFALFISLSANDNVLPTTSSKENQNADLMSNYLSNKHKKMGLLTALNHIKEKILPYRSKKGF